MNPYRIRTQLVLKPRVDGAITWQDMAIQYQVWKGRRIVARFDRGNDAQDFVDDMLRGTICGIMPGAKTR